MTMSISNHPVEHEELMAYLDGELATTRDADTATHLEQCAHCRQLAADLQDVSEMLLAWQVEESEGQVPQKIAEALEAEKKRPSPRGARPRFRLPFSSGRGLLWAGGMALAALIIFAMFTPSLLRSRLGAEKSAQLAREGERANQPESAPGLQDTLRSSRAIARARTPVKVPKFDKLEGDEEQESEDQKETSNVPDGNGPMVIRTAELELTTKEFDKARSGVEEILTRNHGHIGELNVGTPPGSGRTLSGTLRVPANRLDSVLSDLRGLGSVDNESQGGEEVTQQYVDLEARLANAKHTEQRLIDIQRERTGKLSDVLAVEVQIGRVRGEIEQMEAQHKNMKNQVDFATLTLTVSEDYKAELKAVPPSTGTQFHNAAVEGYRSLVDGIIAVLLWLLSVGPTLLIWAAILFFPVRIVWKRLRSRFAK